MIRACPKCGGTHPVGTRCPAWVREKRVLNNLRDEVKHGWRHRPGRQVGRQHYAYKAHLIKEIGHCMWTGCDAVINLELDHVIPIADGGLEDIDNCMLLCSKHHRIKTQADAKRRRKAVKAKSYKGLTGQRRNPDA